MALLKTGDPLLGASDELRCFWELLSEKEPAREIQKGFGTGSKSWSSRCHSSAGGARSLGLGGAKRLCFHV